jgi:hypothetical protein
VRLDALRDVDRAVDAGILAGVRGPARAQHPGDDLEIVTQPGQPLLRRREAVPVRDPLVVLPAGADSQLEPTAADDVDRRRQLRGQGRVPEAGADDHVAQPDAPRQGREGRERRERLERDLVGRLGNGGEVVEDPGRFEPELLGLPDQLAGPLPRRGRIPAVVLALPTLRDQQPDLHAITS